MAGSVTLLLAAALLAGPEPLRYHGRGTYYFDSGPTCPLAGVGSRGPRTCNRLALDDGETTAVVDLAAQRVSFTNAHTYADSTTVGDLIATGWATTKSGQRLPVSVHVVIQKDGDEFEADVHVHPTTHDAMIGADVDTFRVSVSDGKTEHEVATRNDLMKAVREPPLSLRLAQAMTDVHDNLEDVKQDPSKPGFRTADITLILGKGAAGDNLLRLSVTVPGGLTKPAHNLAEVMAQDGGELTITSLSRLLPSDMLERDLFLVGAESVPALARVQKKGLAKGESMVWVIHPDGTGEVRVGADRSPLPHAHDVARAFLEFTFLGGVLTNQSDMLLAALPDQSPADSGVK
jgi:hypothetical protein